MGRRKFEKEILQTFENLLPKLSMYGLMIAFSYARGLEDAMEYKTIVKEEQKR